MKTNVILVPLFGIPGSGKGTIISTLKKLSATNADIQVVSVEMGSHFRKLAQDDECIRQIVDSGNLLSDSTANETFQKLIQEVAANVLFGQELKNKVVILIDGYPRAKNQGENFLAFIRSKNLEVAPVFLELDEEISIQRSRIRRICPQCGATFSIKEHTTCPKCQTRGRRRPDDHSMAHRIAVFNDETLPVIKKARQSFQHQISVESNDLRTAALEIWAFFQNL